jgi:hypothetical protein
VGAGRADRAAGDRRPPAGHLQTGPLLPPARYDAVETEALRQGLIVSLLRARLDALMPEPIEDVLIREWRQREQVAEQLRRLQ